MQRRMFALLASAAIGGANVFRASPTGDQGQSSQTHVSWVAEVLKRMQTIKPGMTKTPPQGVHDRGWVINDCSVRSSAEIVRTSRSMSNSKLSIGRTETGTDGCR